MALLTADDVLNKKFQSVKFREGYDQIEVDEFLDEVVATIYSLSVENAELKEQLAACEEQLQSGVPAEPVQVVETVEVEPVVEQVVEPVVEPVAPVAVPVPVAETAPQEAGGVLMLAQKLHDEYVAEGKAEAERLVNEAESIVTEAKAERESIIADANRQRDDVLSSLAEERRGIETSISQLREFEEDYRKAIAEYLQDLLNQMQQPAAE